MIARIESLTTFTFLVWHAGAVIDALADRSLIIGRTTTFSHVDVDFSHCDAQSLGVSKRHARIEIRGRHIVIEDLASSNGTYVNGKRLRPHQVYVVKHGAELRFGALVCDLYVDTIYL